MSPDAETASAFRAYVSSLGAAEQTIERLLQAANVRHVRRNKVVGQPVGLQHWIVVTRGEIDLYQRAIGSTMLLGICSAPCVVGGCESHGAETVSLFARAREAATVVLVGLEAFHTATSDDPAFHVSLLKSMCEQRAAIINNLVHVTTRPTREQVLRFVWELAEPADAPGVLAVANTSQVRISRALGVCRRTVSRTLETLEREGVLRVQRGRVTLLRPAPHSRGAASWRLTAIEPPPSSLE